MKQERCQATRGDGLLPARDTIAYCLVMGHHGIFQYWTCKPVQATSPILAARGKRGKRGKLSFEPELRALPEGRQSRETSPRPMPLGDRALITRVPSIARPHKLLTACQNVKCAVHPCRALLPANNMASCRQTDIPHTYSVGGRCASKRAILKSVQLSGDPA
jgi:hypothetical protein